MPGSDAHKNHRSDNSRLRSQESSEDFPLLRILSGKNRSALIWAERAHRGQERQPDVPYILHPLSVATLLAGAGGDRNLVCAGCLHDIVEDSSVTIEEIEEEFGQSVAALVASVTKPNGKLSIPLEQQADFIVSKLEKTGQDALALKAADLCSNITENNGERIGR